MSGPAVRIVAAIAGGSEPHRMLSGHGPLGSWSGTGASHPALGATASGLTVGAGAAALDSSHDRRPPPPTQRVAFEIAGADTSTALDRARSRLTRLDKAHSARSWLVTVTSGDGPPAVWLGLGPPSCSVAVRCWPGIVHGPDAAGEDPAPAPLALATDAFCAGVAAGRIPPARVEAALAAAQGTAVAEGLLAERQARLMDAAGDDRGAAVRRLVAQAFAVDVALEALREAVAAAG
jgi:hypothetical protein